MDKDFGRLNKIYDLELNDLAEIDYQEYYLIYSNTIYKFLIEKIENEINIINKNYKINLSSTDLSLLTSTEFNSVDEAYEFIIGIFDKNCAKIINVKLNKKIELLLFINNEKKFGLELIYNKNNRNCVINEIKSLKNEINELKKENNELKKEINYLAYNSIKNSKNNNNKASGNTNPESLSFLSDITKSAYASINFVNTFIAFKSINGITNLIYSNKSKLIISYDLNNQKILKKIKSNHNEYITSFRFFLDKKNNRDIVMSVSDSDNNLKLWNANSWECILNIPYVNNKGKLYSACFLNINNEYYIITSNCNHEENCEFIKAFDFKGYKVKELNDSNDKTCIIETYYDSDNLKNYIITGNNNNVKSFDYEKNMLYNVYYDEDNGSHRSIVMYKNDNIVKMIESSKDGNIRIWNFHHAIMLNKIAVSNSLLYELCLWDNNYIFVGCDDKTIKLVDLKNGLIVKSLSGHNDSILTIRKVNIEQYGECLISQGYKKDQIKLWINFDN